MEEKRYRIIGTAGHIDHGKTWLVKALTGTDTDRLAEEKGRGITIENGFAFLKFPDGREAGIIDVPGHERFIKNMLAGAGGIDIAMVVIAVDEGVMPQTREHLAILSLLGIRKGVLVLTKGDLEWKKGLDQEIGNLQRERFWKMRMW
ncbi:MAG: GTP-binding protein [Blautia faecis]